jgi:6-phosphogluconolactonase (cycloisomerase 2 family)
MPVTTLPRRTFLERLSGGAAAAMAVVSLPLRGQAADQAAGGPAPAFSGLAFVGCFTDPKRNGRGAGLSVYRVSRPGAEWRLSHVSDREVNPSYLALDRQGQFLYVVHADSDRVSAHRIDADRGMLERVNEQSTGGANPAHLALDPSGRWLVAANYTGGSVALLPVRPDGALGERTSLVSMAGDVGPHRIEQAVAHPHQCVFDRSGRLVFVPDKGLDRVFAYRLDPVAGTLVPAEAPAVRSRAGAGPRHMALHPTLPLAYVVNEIDSTVTVCRMDEPPGHLRPVQVITALPTSYVGDNTAAAIVVSASGRFVYTSNRGHDSVATFRVDPVTGELVSVGWQDTGGRVPRFITFDPTGRTLYAANQATDTLVGFDVDDLRGTLTPTGWVLRTGTPVCVVFRGA